MHVCVSGFSTVVGRSFGCAPFRAPASPRFLSTFKDNGKAASLGEWQVIDGESPDAVQVALTAAGVLNGRPQ